MNRYGAALMNEKRKANTSVVRMVLKTQPAVSEKEAVGLKLRPSRAPQRRSHDYSVAYR
jgi:hypothetical protein